MRRQITTESANPLTIPPAFPRIVLNPHAFPISSVHNSVFPNLLLSQPRFNHSITLPVVPIISSSPAKEGGGFSAHVICTIYLLTLLLVSSQSPAPESFPAEAGFAGRWLCPILLTFETDVARSRLYRSQSLQLNTHFAAFFKIYKIIGIPFLILLFFQIFCTVFTIVASCKNSLKNTDPRNFAEIQGV